MMYSILKRAGNKQLGVEGRVADKEIIEKLVGGIEKMRMDKEETSTRQTGGKGEIFL